MNASRKSRTIEAMARDRDIRCLLHFTPIVNLPNIVRHGLSDRNGIYDNRIVANAPAAHRYDRNDAAVSLSVSAVSAKMLSAKRSRMPRMPFAVLMLEPSLLWTRECVFFSENAASREMTNRRGYAGGPARFAEMFSDGAAPTRWDGTDYRASNGIPSFMTTRSDAEVQVSGVIPAEAVRLVWIEDAHRATEINALINAAPGPERFVAIGPFDHVGNAFDAWIVPDERWLGSI